MDMSTVIGMVTNMEGRPGKTLSFKFETDDYKHGDRGYDKYMGDHDEYKQGYRSGYQMATMMPSTVALGDLRRFMVVRILLEPFEIVITMSQKFALEVIPDIAFDIGYRDGVQAGAKDLDKHDKFDPADHDRYRDGDHDYQNSYGDKEVYKLLPRRIHAWLSRWVRSLAVDNSPRKS